MLYAKHLFKSYGNKKILSDVSFHIQKEEFVSLMGPSGEGKSTLARILCGTVKPDAGAINFSNESLFTQKGNFNPKFRRNIQLISQQPYAALDPRQTIGNAIAEPLLFYKIAQNKADARKRAMELLKKVLLSPSLYDRRPGELSGGQAQRVLIARSLTVSPSLLIADEATSMLDVSSQAQIIKILKQLIRDEHLSVLLISHDYPLVTSISDRIYKLNHGELTKL